MFGPRSTATAIDAFEKPFTVANGADFFIAKGGSEAYPLIEGEAAQFKKRYRDAMRLSGTLRWVLILSAIPMLMLLGRIVRGAPEWMAPATDLLKTPGLSLFILFGLPLIAVLQHPIASDVLQSAIERPLRRRMTTRYEPAITPVGTRLGIFAKWLLIVAAGVEISIVVYHSVGPVEEYAQHMRVLYGLEAGNEGWRAHLTGTLSRYAQLSIVAGALLMMLDRRNRRRAEAREVAARAPAAE